MISNSQHTSTGQSQPQHSPPPPIFSNHQGLEYREILHLASIPPHSPRPPQTHSQLREDPGDLPTRFLVLAASMRRRPSIPQILAKLSRPKLLEQSLHSPGLLRESAQLEHLTTLHVPSVLYPPKYPAGPKLFESDVPRTCEL